MGTGQLIAYKGRVRTDDGKIIDVDVHAYYLGLSYHGSVSDSIITRIVAFRKDTGQVVEVVPSQVKFIGISDDIRDQG